MQRMGRAVSRARRWSLAAGGVGSVAVGLLVLAAPLAGANYVSGGWAAIGSASAAGPVIGSGVNAPALGQPTAALVAGTVHVTYGFSSSSGPGVGTANYEQSAWAWATPAFTAWKPAGSSYNVSVLYGFQLHANDVQASVNCLAGGSASADAIISVQIAIYDVSTGTYAATLGPGLQLPFGFSGAPTWIPFNVSCTPGGSASAGNPAMTLPALGNLTGPIGIYLTAGNVYQVEGLIAAYANVTTITPGASASGTVSFVPGDFVEIAKSTAY